MRDIWQHSHEDSVISISRNVHPGWYHFALLSHISSPKLLNIISREKRVIELVQQFGFTVYSTLEKIHSVAPDSIEIIQHNLKPSDYVRFHAMRWWQKIFQKAQQALPEKKMDIFSVKHSSWYILVLWIVLILLLITSIISLTSPHATIEITPQATITDAVKNIVFVTEEAVSSDSEVPLRKKIFSYEASKTFSITTFNPLSLKRAQGKVSLYNGGTSPINLKPKTRLVTDNIVFRTTKWVTIPPAVDSELWHIVVDVIADDVSSVGMIGKKGNIPTNTPLSIPWLEGSDIDIQAIAIEDFAWGDDSFEPLLTTEEYIRLENLFREYLLSKAREDIIRQYSHKNDYIPLPIPEAVTDFSIKIRADQEVGSRESKITFYGSGDFLVHLYNADQVRKNIIDLASSHLLQWVESFVDTGSSLSIVQVLNYEKEPLKFKATVQIPVKVLYDFESSIGQKTLQNILSDLLWSDKDRAEKSLLNHPYIQKIDIYVTPFWSKKIPFSLKNIDIKVKK